MAQNDGDGREQIQRYDKLKSNLGVHVQRWEKMAPFVAPSRVGMAGSPAIGEKLLRGVYDSTGLVAAELMAMFIAGHIINPSQRWLSMTMGDLQSDTQQSREWLEECRDITLKRLASSMFYAEAPEHLIDYAGFGTGCMITDEMPQPINKTIKGFRGFSFSAEKTGRFIIQDGIDGTVDTLFREFEATARVISQRWFGGNVSEAMPENVQQALRNGKPDEMFTIIHGIYPRERSKLNSYVAKGMPWASCWIEYKSKTIIHESGYRLFPAVAPRYMRTPGDPYGRGRGDLAFPDISTLNTAKRMALEDWALKLRPPILHASDSVIGTLRLTPGGPTSINTHGRAVKDVIAPFETGSNPQLDQINEENLRKSIREIFYVDHILALLQVEKSEMTAFEFAKKMELLFKLMGPVYGRLEWEWLHKQIDILWDLQWEAKAFPPPPPEVMQGSGKIDIEFQNPLAKAQRSGDAEALQMLIGDVGPLTQVHPDMWDRLDADKAFAGVAETRGIPAKWLRSDKDMAALRSAKDQQNQQELALARLEQGAGAMGKAAPMVKLMKDGGIPGMPTNGNG